MSFPKRNDPHLEQVPLTFKELEKRERLFQAVLDGFPEPIEIIDRSFNVIYLNAAAEKRSKTGALKETGEKCYQVFYDRKEPCAYCPAKKTFDVGEPGFVLLKNVNANDYHDSCFEELLLLPVKPDQTGEKKNGQPQEGVEWVVEIARDVTRKKELEQQLISSERLVQVGEMTASIAHEFNNPLGIILGFAQDLLTEVDPVDPRYNSLKIIEEEARRCKKIMQNLLEFGRPTPAQFTYVDSEEILHKGMGLISGQAPKMNVQTKLVIQNKLPPIWADPQQVMQVLVNLFFNAMEAMPDGGTLTVRGASKREGCNDNRGNSLAPSSNEVVISVEDTGAGIHPNDLPKIFRTFFTTKQKKGMGLGLSVCENIMKGHGGRIAVESIPGKGATFYLYFPVKEKLGDNGGE
jgi:two-component system NtrC family sensor kinase